MPIDVFSRLAPDALDRAEEFVLRQLLAILDRRGEDAVILVNILLDRHEIDLVVATQTVTLVIEVKGYRQAVEGLINDRKWRVIATGKALDNPYAQVNSASLELKDALRNASGADPGYAHAVLLFAYGIPSGSILPKSDHRVTISGAEALETLLSTPIPAGTKRRLWDPELVRWFARTSGLAPMADQAIRPVRAEEVDYVEVSDETDRSSALPVTMPWSSDRRHSSAPWPAHVRPSKGRSRLRAVILSMIALPIVASGVSSWLHHRNITPSKPASGSHSPHTPVRRHAATAAAHRQRALRTPDDSGAGSSVLFHPQRSDLAARAAETVPPSAVAPPPPCPPGIDRLGCVPDAQTLSKLRND